jgi:hypothetical protein
MTFSTQEGYSTGPCNGGIGWLALAVLVVVAVGLQILRGCR